MNQHIGKIGLGLTLGVISINVVLFLKQLGFRWSPAIVNTVTIAIPTVTFIWITLLLHRTIGRGLTRGRRKGAEDFFLIGLHATALFILCYAKNIWPEGTYFIKLYATHMLFTTVSLTAIWMLGRWRINSSQPSHSARI